MTANQTHPFKFAGIHLAGSNSQRTAVIVLQGDPLLKPLDIIGLYEKIGSQGKLFSDDRLVGILMHEGPLERIFVDCPLSQPPCVSCSRLTCPGVTGCEDIAVAYMLSLSQKLEKQGKRRKRPINPQSQRLWDVEQVVADRVFLEPSYSANMAPLVTRALVLQRRLNSLGDSYRLQETSVEKSLIRLAKYLHLEPTDIKSYRSFEHGASIREDIVSALIDQKWLRAPDPSDNNYLNQIVMSLEIFQSLIAAIVASLSWKGLIQNKPDQYLVDEGWVYLPELSVEMT